MMKRLLAQTGIAYFSALVVAFYLSDYVLWLLIGAAVVSLALFLIPKTRQTVYLPAVALSIVIACAFNLGYTALSVDPTVRQFKGESRRIEATLTDEPYRQYQQYYYPLTANRVDGTNADFKLLLKTDDALDLEPFDTISFTASLAKTDSQYRISKGYYLSINKHDDDYQISHTETVPLYAYAIRLRGALREALDEYLPSDEAALCRAVLIGDKYALDLSIRDSFRYSGASHFIVVSGMHFSVLTMLIYFFLRRLRKRWLTLGIMIAFIFTYMAVTGFQVSVLRSGIMMLFLVVGNAIRRQTYPLNHLGISGVVMTLILGPYCAGDISLILSYYATLAILLWAGPISRKICFKDAYGNILTFRIRASIARWVNPLHKNKRNKPAAPSDVAHVQNSFSISLKKAVNMIFLPISVTLAANILVFPISVFAFGGFSLVTLISAVVLYPEIYLILIFALLVCLFFYTGPLRIVSLLLAWPLYYLCRLVLWLVDAIGSLPFAYIRIHSDFVYIWLIVSMVMLFVVVCFRNHYRHLPLALVGSSILLIAGLMMNAVTALNTSQLEVYDCGYGVCVGLYHRGRLYLLELDADYQSRYGVLDRIAQNYTSAEAVVCSDITEKKRYAVLNNKEFAISSYLLYDNEGYGLMSDDVETFTDSTTFVYDDDLSISLNTDTGQLLCRVSAGDREILIVPRNFPLAKLEDQMLYADIVVMARPYYEYDRLRCDQMVISDEREMAVSTADILRDCYQKAYYTYDGDIIMDLR